MNSSKHKQRRVLIVALLIGVLAFMALSAVAYVTRSAIRSNIQQVIAQAQSEPDDTFPDVDVSKFSVSERQLLNILRAEYAKKPVSFDSNVLKYTDGEKQPWCADFVSWAMGEAGRPFKNPNSGGWRIPGVYTLREYFQSQNRYILAGDYTPTFGDVAIYDKTPTNSHTNIVLSVDTKAKTMTLIGGNENGRVRIIHNQSYTLGTRDLVGFGVGQLLTKLWTQKDASL